MRFAFLIPLVHPQNPRVNNYNTVEALLRLTLDNLAGQTYDNVFVIVVCHKLPEWHKAAKKNVHFLLFQDHPDFPLDAKKIGFHRTSIIDKGLKFLVGLTYARDRLGASFVMPMDADDFVHKDLARRIVTGSVKAGGKDGWIISKGYHVKINVCAERIHFKAAYRVTHFNRNCGSCRILRGDSIDSTIAAVAPELLRLRSSLPYETPGLISNHVMDALFDIGQRVRSIDAPLITLGDHIFQDRLFDFGALNEPLAAKGCGHGNHAARDGVYWYRVTQQIPLERFLSDFRLDGTPLASASPEPVRQVGTWCKSWASFFSEIGPSLSRRYRYWKAK